jgi:hypothetical protein
MVRIFASWATVSLGSFLKIVEEAYIFGLLMYFHGKSHVIITFVKNWVGLHFGRFCSQTHLVTLVHRASMRREK